MKIMLRRFRGWTAAAIVAYLLAGCASLAPEPDRTRYYTLSAPATETPVDATPADAVLVGVRVSHLADYLQRPGIVVRASGHEIRYAAFDRWADRLEGAVARAVAEALAPKLAEVARITTAGAVRAPVPPVVLELEVVHFDARGGESPAALITIDWRVFAGDDGAAVATGRFQAEKPGWREGDFGHFASLAGAAVEELAASVVEPVRKAVAGARPAGDV